MPMASAHCPSARLSRSPRLEGCSRLQHHVKAARRPRPAGSERAPVRGFHTARYTSASRVAEMNGKGAVQWERRGVLCSGPLCALAAFATTAQHSSPAQADTAPSDPAAEQQSPVGYQSVTLTVGGVEVPAGIWYPLEEGAAAAAGAPTATPYEYRIGIGKLFKVFLGFKLPFPAPTTALAGGGGVIAGAKPPATSASPAIIFAHGYLGSRFDAVTLCEALARQGFTVAAPDFAESVMASFEPNDATSRTSILQTLQSLLRREFGADAFGIFGHSAGGGSATMTEGPFALGRCAIAGARAYGGPDPLFLVASSGDGVIPLDRVREALPPGIVPVGRAAEIDWSKNTSGALFIEEPLPGEEAPPNHLSFLDAETNAALVKFLSPLLPLAKLLRLRVLDFGVYKQRQDSQSCTEAYRPAVIDFFVANRDRIA